MRAEGMYIPVDPSGHFAEAGFANVADDATTVHQSLASGVEVLHGILSGQKCLAWIW